jgi:hypothetical protein
MFSLYFVVLLFTPWLLLASERCTSSDPRATLLSWARWRGVTPSFLLFVSSQRLVFFFVFCAARFGCASGFDCFLLDFFVTPILHVRH